MIYISTGGFKNKTAFESAKNLMENGIYNIELSGGKYDKDCQKNIKTISNNGNILIHNYFPPPKAPFVMNLASLDDDIYNLTNKHIKSAINFASELGIKIYSFHAGFLMDPQPFMLGKTFASKGIQNRIETIKIFQVNQES